MTVRFDTFYDAGWQKVLFRSPTKDPLAGVGKIRKSRTIPHIKTYAGLPFVYVEIVFFHEPTFPPENGGSHNEYYRRGVDVQCVCVYHIF